MICRGMADKERLSGMLQHEEAMSLNSLLPWNADRDSQRFFFASQTQGVII